MSWDPKAERITAKAEQTRAKAEAEERQARVAMEWHERQEEREQANRAERRAAGAARRKAAGSFVRKYLALFPAVPAIGAPMVIAWNGQYTFATKAMHLGAWLAPLLPVALEGGALYTSYLAYMAVEDDKPAGRYRIATVVLASVAAGINVSHGKTLPVGVALGLTSLLTPLLLELTVAWKAGRKAARTAADIRRALIRRLRYPLLSASAAGIAAARGVDTEAAWTAAWVNRYGLGPDSTRAERRVGKRVVKRQLKAATKAAKDGSIVIRDGRLTPVVERPAEYVEAGDAPKGNPLDDYIGGGLAELEHWVNERPRPISGGGTAIAELPPAPSNERPGERSDGPEMSAQAEAEVSGNERSPKPRNERKSERSNGGRSERANERSRKGWRGRKVSRSERPQVIKKLITERPEITSAEIQEETGIPESSARRIRADIERGDK